ncbi:MAG: hypothetical protein SVV80_07405 [Planctomycetota bacterium]|nr:hypothetical protein [Planctomycetota bacterium]
MIDGVSQQMDEALAHLVHYRPVQFDVAAFGMQVNIFAFLFCQVPDHSGESVKQEAYRYHSGLDDMVLKVCHQSVETVHSR